MPGGVCAVLDYEVELMAEYVAEMSTRLAMGTPRASESFRKFIAQILSSTRLPRTTILLGMNYLAKRINIMNMMSASKLTLSEGHVWRLLTVALLLGSKFLDDNTFQNRSWADVSGIPVSELNKLEREWMEAITWCLYVNLDRSEDYTAWINSWREWETAKIHQQQALATRERLASMSMAAENDYANNTHNSVAYSAWYCEQITEYERLSKAKRNDQPMPQTFHLVNAHDQSQGGWMYHAPHHDPWSGAPLTPPDSGYGTPEYVGSAQSYMSLTSPTTRSPHYEDWVAHQQAAAAAQQNARRVSIGYVCPQYPMTAKPTPYHSRSMTAKLPPYNFYGHNIWEHSIENANGTNCFPHAHNTQASYFGVPHTYGQPVMG